MPSAKLKRIAIALGVVLAVLLLGRRVAVYVPQFASWVESLGPWGPVAFIAGYALFTVALVPGSVLTLAGGALFGLTRGTIYVFIAATIGAIAAFLIARHLVRDVVLRKAAGNPRFHAVDDAVRREGRKIVFLIRLSPLFPFSATNYLLGLTSVRLRDYALACTGMLPGTLLYVYYGRVLGDLASVAAGKPVTRGTGYWVVLAMGLVATLLVTAIITRAARRALNASIEEPAT